MKCIIFGGSGEVGGAVSLQLIRSDICSQLTMLVRRTIPSMQNEAKVKQIVVNTEADNFEAIVTDAAQGHEAAISCIGIGSGTFLLNEDQLMEVEVHMLGRYARGCKTAGVEIFELLTAVGVKESHASSKIKVIRVMGKKYKTVLEVNFKKLAVFQPGMIVGNAHTPRWLTIFTRFIPDSAGWGNIHQEEVARAFLKHLEKEAARQEDPVVSYGDKEMKLLAANQS